MIKRKGRGKLNLDVSFLVFYMRIVKNSNAAIWKFVFYSKFLVSEVLLHDECVSISDLGSEGFGDLIACIRNSNIPLQNNIHFVVTLH
jgi:hypothetical protein